MKEYIIEVSTAPLPATSRPLDTDEINQRLERARLHFLNKLEPRLRRATGKDRGCDAASVDQYLETARSLALQDMTSLLAHAATMARAFPDVRKGGYSSLSVEVFLNKMDEALKQYVEEVSRASDEDVRPKR
jgi:hypothetical protein